MELLGVVLAGGQSRRMGGSEKSLLELAGKPLIEHVADRLGSQVSNLLVNANGDPARFSALNLPIQPDTVDGFAGPLAGVLAGMNWAVRNTNASHIITAAADTPFFPADYVSRMSQGSIDQNIDIVLAHSNGRRHPVFGLWPVAMEESLKSFLVDEDNRKVMIFAERFANGTVNFDGRSPDPFFNVNTPDDMADAERIAREMVTV